MLRYAILTHDFPTPHLDLFLESGSILRSWRLPINTAPGISVPIEPMPDHRIHYLDYEGPVSGNRGTVACHDRGTFVWEVETSDRLVVRLRGTRFVGLLTLARTPGGWEARMDPD